MPTAIEQHTIQESLDNLQLTTWDTVVVGAGPAGSAAASVLARRGRAVLLIDREQFPRDKACGDCLLSDAIDSIERIGALPEVNQLAHKLSCATVYSPSRYHFGVPGRYLTLRRKQLDFILARHARSCGATFCRGSVSGIEDNKSGKLQVTFRDASVRLDSRHVILCTGADIDLAAQQGMVTSQPASAVAIRQYVRSSYKIEEMILSYDRSLVPGYAWIIPMGESMYNIGCGYYLRSGKQDGRGLKKALQRFKHEFPPAANLMHGADKSSRIAGAALRCGLEGTAPSSGDRILAAGETIGATFPFTGEGIGKAMETAELAARVVDRVLNGDIRMPGEEYARLLQTDLLPNYQGYFMAQRWLSNPRINDFVARRIQKSPLLQERFKEFVSETGDPKTVFALWTFLRSFLR